METRVVRLRPPRFDGDVVVRRHLVGGVRFEQGRGWYEVPVSLAAELATVHVHVDDPRSPLAFDICADRNAALAYEERLHKEAEEARAAITTPRVVEWTGTVHSLGTSLKPETEPATTGVLRPPPPAQPHTPPPPPVAPEPVPEETVEDLAASVEAEEEAAAEAAGVRPVAVEPTAGPSRRVVRRRGT